MGVTAPEWARERALTFVLAGLLAAGFMMLVRSGVAIGDAVRALPAVAEASATAAQPTPASTDQKALAQYQAMPLSFIPNRGQMDARVRYYATGAGYSFLFTKTKAIITLADGPDRSHVLNLRFIAANSGAELGVTGPQQGRVNYLVGSDPSAWQRGIPTYSTVVYQDLWPGIDMRFHGANGQLKYEFVVHPGANPGDIRLAYGGADRISVGATGELRVHTGSRTITDSRPVSYQQAGRQRSPVASSYALLGGTTYAFALGAYDASRRLTIDPGLQYSTFIGGFLNDEATAIFVEGGKAYVTGQTHSSEYPTTAGAFDNTYGPGADVFVTKLDSDGSTLLYSTFVGGVLVGGIDVGEDIFVKSGEAYVTGETFSVDFPTTPGAWDQSHNGADDGFVFKLNTDGSALVYSTFLGGSGGDQGRGIDVWQGRAYVTGVTFSPTFPVTPGAVQATHGGLNDAFVARLNPTGSVLEYSTFLGGFSQEEGQDIDTEDGEAVVTGFTGSFNFPSTPTAHDDTHNGGHDVFVTKLNSTGTGLVYSTFLGGSLDDEGYGVAIHAHDAYVTGVTSSQNFRTTAGAYDTSYNGGLSDAFAAKLNRYGTHLLYSTYLGGENLDLAEEIVVHGGNAYVAGQTNSLSYPVTPDAFDQSYEGGTRDAFATQLDDWGSELIYSTYLGGSQRDQARDLAVDGGNIYMTGFTTSEDFPTTPGVWDNSWNGNRDVFVTKLGT